MPFLQMNYSNFMSEFDITTGEKAKVSGNYRYNGSPDRSVNCTPTLEECIIPLEKGETAPPVKSCNSSANWKLVK